MNEAQRIIDVYTARDSQQPAGLFAYEGLFHFVRIAERQRETLRLMQAAGLEPLADKRILDVGCGNGSTLRTFLEWGAAPANVSGIDLRPDAVNAARLINPTLDVRCGSADALPYGEGSFDLVCMHTVLTSVLDASLRQRIARETHRVLRPRGFLLWYDFRYDNPRNKNVNGIGRSAIRKLFPCFTIQLRPITLAPPLARRIPASLLPVFYPILSAVPFLRTHYLGLLEKDR